MYTYLLVQTMIVEFCCTKPTISFATGCMIDYTQEVSKQLEAGTQVEVQVDTQKGLLEADLEIFKTWVKIIQLYLYGIPYIVYKFDRILLINHEPHQNN